MNTISTDWASAGDLVEFRNTIYRVVKNMNVNLRVIDEDGKTWKLRKGASVKFAPEGTVFHVELPEDPSVTVTSFQMPHPNGTVFKFNHGKFNDGKRYVVIRSTGDTHSAVELNGTGGSRYVRGIHRSSMNVEVV